MQTFLCVCMYSSVCVYVCMCVCVVFLFCVLFLAPFGFWVYEREKNRCGNRACIIEVDEHLRKSFLQFDRAPKRCACVAMCVCVNVAVCACVICLYVCMSGCFCQETPVFPIAFDYVLDKIAFEYVLDNIAKDGLHVYIDMHVCLSLCMNRGEPYLTRCAPEYFS